MPVPSCCGSGHCGSRLHPRVFVTPALVLQPPNCWAVYSHYANLLLHRLRVPRTSSTSLGAGSRIRFFFCPKPFSFFGVRRRIIPSRAIQAHVSSHPPSASSFVRGLGPLQRPFPLAWPPSSPQLRPVCGEVCGAGAIFSVRFLSCCCSRYPSSRIRVVAPLASGVFSWPTIRSHSQPLLGPQSLPSS